MFENINQSSRFVTFIQSRLLNFHPVSFFALKKEHYPASLLGLQIVKRFRYKDALLEDTKLYASEEGFAFNPLAIYKTIKNFAYELKDVKKIMMESRYEGKNSFSL